MTMRSVWSLLLLGSLIVDVAWCAGPQEEEEDADDPWYTSGELPVVDLEGLIANLSAQISWFKYVGAVTLDCAAKAHREDTLVLAIQTLYDCLEANHQECASEFGKQSIACSSNYTSMKPCGNLRLGYGDGTHYDNAASCRWYLQVPDGFVMNLTIDQFYVEYSGPDCIYDKVYVYDGHSTSNRTYGPLCGRIDRFTIYATTDVMMVVATTDLTVAKYGFRAVYQVMDPGLGINNSPAMYHTSPAGSLNLSATGWVIYESDFNAWYYYKWYITTDVSQNFRVTAYYKADVNGSVALYDGPSENNIRLGLLLYIPPPRPPNTEPTTQGYRHDITTNRPIPHSSDPVTGEYPFDDVTTGGYYNSSLETMTFKNDSRMTSRKLDNPNLGFTSRSYTAPRLFRNTMTDMTSPDPNMTTSYATSDPLGPNVTSWENSMTTQSAEVSTIGAEQQQQPVQEMEVNGTLSHQMVLVLKRSLLTDDTEFNLTYTSQPKGQLNLIQDTQCIGQTRQEVTLDDLDIEIGLMKEAAILDGVPIQCFWNISVPEDNFVQLQITSLHFNSPTSHDCMHEGLLIIDGSNFDPDQPRYGPYCYDDPRGLFAHLGRGSVNNLTTSGRHLFVMYYSFVNYEMSPWPRGPFRALVRATQCQGMLQLCSLTPVVNTTTLRVVKQLLNDTLHVDAYCDKVSCCVLQQLPIYGQHDFTHCHLSVNVYRQHLIATNTFEVGLAVPNKEDTSILYSCERKEQLSKRKPGGGQALCLGTQIFISYSTTSSWARGAFTVKVTPSPCGYYKPELHPHNTFFPPCMKADIPPRPGRYEFHITDPHHTDSTYYEIRMDFANLKCRKIPACNNVKILLRSSYVADAWSRVATWPWRWFTWGNVYQNVNWTQTLTIIRDPPEDADQNATCWQLHKEDCLLVVKVNNASMTKKIPPEDHTHTCPSGFEAVGTSCYAWVWPGRLKAAPRGSLPLDVKMSTDQAAQKCRALTEGQTHSAHLVDIDSATEAEYLTSHIFHSWYRQVLSHLPGVKVIHMGVNDTVKGGRYVTSSGKPSAYSAWHVSGMLLRGPDYFLHAPSDQTGTVPLLNSSLTAQGLPSVRHETLEEALKVLQPDSTPQRHCTVKLINGNKMASPWLKVACDVPLLGAVGLCEVIPKTTSAPTGSYGDLRVNSNYTTYIQQTSQGDALTINTAECPTSMNLAGDLCYAIYVPTTPGRVLKEMPRSRCPGLFGKHHSKKGHSRKAEMAYVDEEVLELIQPLLMAWKLNDPNQGIRVLSRNPDTNELDACYAIFINTSDNISNYNQHVEEPFWSLTALGGNSSSCRDPRVTAFLCQTPPVHVHQACNFNIQKACADGTCILATHQCDGVPDCLDGSDEAKCDAICRPVPWRERRNKKEYCAKRCLPGRCTCSEMYFQCKSGGCVPISKHCDHQLDCSDGSDEAFCNIPACKENELKCNNTYQCYKPEQSCDLIKDCDDGSDEDGCDITYLCQVGRPDFMLCGDNETCLSASLRDDYVLDCPPSDNGTDESAFLQITRSIVPNKEGLVDLEEYHGEQCVGNDMSCSELLPKCYNRMEHACVHRLHPVSDMLVTCRLGQHLQRCGLFQCPSMFKCPNSYCVPLDSVCDGTKDCEWGEDEAHCEQFYCPGMFKCKGSRHCLHQERVCDGKVDCPIHSDDEQLCNLRNTKCPHDKCLCRGHATRCLGTRFLDLETEGKMPPSTIKAFIYRGNDMWNLPYAINRYYHIYRLDASNNKLSSVTLETFTKMMCLEELYLHNNQIESLSNTYQRGLYRLRVITLYGNQIRYIAEGTFTSLLSLEVLDLGGQLLQTMERKYFSNMPVLRVLNLSHNELTRMSKSALADHAGGKMKPLPSLMWVSLEYNPLDEAPMDIFTYVPANCTLRTDRFKFCCYSRHVKKCFPEADEFSTCEDMLASRPLRVFVWVTGLMALIGNILVFFQRVQYEKETVPSNLIQHLAFADLLIAVYMLIIASADIYHRGIFITRAEEWQDSALCKFAGFLHMVGVEMAMLVITLITADRVYALVPFCRSRGLSMSACRSFLALGWTGTIILGLVPVVEYSYYTEPGYTTNGVCMLFNIIGGGKKAHWEYSLSIFSVFNAGCVLTMCIGYGFTYYALQHGLEVWMWQLPDDISDRDKDIELTFRRNEVVIARRTMIIIFTNFTIWLPIVGMGSLAFLGVYVDKVTAAWVGLFLVPINSVLNPYMFTFSAGPHTGRYDDLLLNWVPDLHEYQGEEMEEDPDVDKPYPGAEGDATMADVGETSIGPSTVSKTEMSSVAYLNNSTRDA